MWGYLATILLVDNDPLQALARKSVLERRFDDVQRVMDAAEALCLVEQPEFAGNLALVVSDLQMPGIGGPEFVAELHARLPNLPILVLGNATDVAENYTGGWIRFLARPFPIDEMLNVAGQMVLDNVPSAA
jgi:two-component system, NtrC family, C4-dicarboxylate transport response regulator DctD